MTLAELAVLRGKPEAAIARLEPLAGEEGGFRIPIETTLVWSLVEAGEVTRAGHLIAASVAQAGQQGERLALVDALRVQGMVMRREGRNAEAKQVLAEGLALARELKKKLAGVHGSRTHLGTL